MAFLALVVVPATRGMAPVERARLFETVGRRFRVVGWACVLVLVATGLVNLGYRGVTWEAALSGALWGTPFGQVLALKLAMVVAMVALGLVHDVALGPASARADAGSAQ